MKKFSVIMVLCVLFLCACQQSKPLLPAIPTEDQQCESQAIQTASETEPVSEIPTETQPEIQTEPETETETEIPTESQAESETETDSTSDPQPELDHSIAYDSVEELLKGLWEKQNAQNGDAGTNSVSTSVSTVFPVLKKTDLRFVYMAVIPDDRVEYVFGPIGIHCPDLDERTVVNVYFSDYNSGKYAEEPRNEYGAFYKHGMWWFSVEGHTVAVQLQWNAYVDTSPFEDVAEYFSDFQVVTYSPTAETNAVQ